MFVIKQHVRAIAAIFEQDIKTGCRVHTHYAVSDDWRIDKFLGLFRSQFIWCKALGNIDDATTVLVVTFIGWFTKYLNVRAVLSGAKGYALFDGD